MVAARRLDMLHEWRLSPRQGQALRKGKKGSCRAVHAACSQACMRLAAKTKVHVGGRRAGGRRGRAWRTLSGQRAVHAVGSQATCRACGLQPGAACSTIAVLHVVTAYPVWQDTRHRLGWGRPQFVVGQEPRHCACGQVSHRWQSLYGACASNSSEQQQRATAASNSSGNSSEQQQQATAASNSSEQQKRHQLHEQPYRAQTPAASQIRLAARQLRARPS